MDAISRAYRVRRNAISDPVRNAPPPEPGGAFGASIRARRSKLAAEESVGFLINLMRPLRCSLPGKFARPVESLAA